MANKASMPLVVFVLACMGLAFLAGTLSTHYEVFPYPQIREAGRTMRALIKMRAKVPKLRLGAVVGPAAIPAGEAAGARWQIFDDSALQSPVIVNGGLNQFLHLCPDHGCLAVAFNTEGKVSEVWPYRPIEIYSADITKGAYEHEFLFFDPRINVYPISVQRYADGDVLVNFQQAGGGIFPFGMGVARVAPDGTPRWTRFDFSHHWSTLRADEVAYVPSLKIGLQNLRFVQGSAPSAEMHNLICKTRRPMLDVVQVLAATGRVVDEIELVPILLESNWVGLLAETTDPCDPLHLNYIDVVRDDAGPGLEPGDLVLSLRNISRFVILNPETKEIKRVVAGGFVQQHSVHHLSGSKFLIFDNRGGDALGPASRIVELDLATGRERRIFPNAETPDAYAQVFTDRSGYIDISPDRRRVLASFTHAGRAFEVDIATGRLLAAYDNVHDITSVPDVPVAYQERAARFSVYGMSYLAGEKRRSIAGAE